MEKKRKIIPLDVIVPPMGEGIQEVKIIKFFKNIGDTVNKDELLYEMETDKSVVEIESPYSGEFFKWEAKEGDIIPVGTIIGKIKGEPAKYVRNAQEEDFLSEKLSNDITQKNLGNSLNILRHLPPRTRKYCQEKGVNIESIPIPDKRLMPEDIDNYIKEGKVQITKIAPTIGNHKYKEIKLSDQQKILNRRFKYSKNNIVPISMVARIPLKKLYKAKEVLIGNSNEENASIFQAFAYCVAQTCCDFPKFRSLLIDSETLHEYEHLSLGIAVENKMGDLMTAVIPKSENYNFKAFIEKMHLHIAAVQQGTDQGAERPHVMLTYMGECDILWGSPLLVEPAVAILFLSLDKEKKNYAYLSITVDHRIINGMEVVRFLKRLTTMIDDLGSL
ncbi:MAG: 2-oxo acid dehydrogenase subunit E2 [Alphaproteobacteria bacterium]|nr:2-oxo acid dehydrogenase subunit E2 [Alphaproteobacteria bacterium]MBY0501896.1 2-oxo acid dehydrogenase subunit E2 [Alphaproteobacteria bacterium]